MGVRNALKRIDAGELFTIQRNQYRDFLIMEVSVPAGQTVMGRVGVGTLGDFLCQEITGDFECLNPGVAGDIDDGICHLRARLIDSGGSRLLMNDYIPLSLFLTPGRRRSVNALNAVVAGGGADTSPAPQQLFCPIAFEYLFATNTDILCDVRSDSTAAHAQIAHIVFHGIRIRSPVSGGAPVRPDNPARRR